MDLTTSATSTSLPTRHVSWKRELWSSTAPTGKEAYQITHIHTQMQMHTQLDKAFVRPIFNKYVDFLEVHYYHSNIYFLNTKTKRIC